MRIKGRLSSDSLIFGVIILLFCGCASEQRQVEKEEGPVDLRSGLVAWYTFDESEGTIAHDSAGGHNGMVHGATWAEGKIGGALDFDGVSDYVSVPDSPELNITGDLTIAAWVNFREGGLEYDGSEKAIVTKCYNNGAFNNPFDFRTSISTEPVLAMVRADQGSHECLYGDKHMTLNSWHHVAVRVKDGAIDFYVDGDVLTDKSWGCRLLKAVRGAITILCLSGREAMVCFSTD